MQLDIVIRKKSSKKVTLLEEWVSEKEMREELKWSPSFGYKTTHQNEESLEDHDVLSCSYMFCHPMIFHFLYNQNPYQGRGSKGQRSRVKPNVRHTFGHHLICCPTLCFCIQDDGWSFSTYIYHTAFVSFGSNLCMIFFLIY